MLNYMINWLYLIALILSVFYASEGYTALIGKLSARKTALSSSSFYVNYHLNGLLLMTLDRRTSPESGRVHALNGGVKIEKTYWLDQLGNSRR